MTANTTVELESVSKAFDGGRVLAVDHVSLAVQEGTLVTLLGPSGCGKTTLLRTIAGLGVPDSGRVLIKGKDVTAVPANQRRVGMVFQNYALFPHMSVFQNVAYGLQMLRLPRREIAARVSSILTLAQIGHLADRSTAELSGGQQQRVAVARALVVEPDVLLLDEPLSNLDAKLRRYMREEIRSLQQRLQITAIYVTHDQEEAMAISDEIVVMYAGRVQQVGKPMDVYQCPISEFVAGFMGQANWLEGRIVAREEDGQSALVEALCGAVIRVRIPKEGSISLDPGSEIRAFCRPESLRPVDGDGVWQGQVVDSVYVSGAIHYRVRIGDVDWVIQELAYPGSRIWPRGSTVGIQVYEDAFQCIGTD